MLACSTANALCLVDCGHHGRLLVVLVKWVHSDGTRWAMARAVATRDGRAILVLVAGGNAQEVGPHGMTYLY